MEIASAWIAVVNAVIALSFYAVAALIFAGLVKERQAGFNQLGIATVLIFFTCASGHAMHVEHYFQYPTVYAQIGDLWHQGVLDGLTVIPAIAYLAQRRRYGLVIRGPHALLDFKRRLNVSEALRSIGEDIAAKIDLDDLLLLVTQHARVLLGADYAAVVANDHLGRLRCHRVGTAHDWEEGSWRSAVLMSEDDTSPSSPDSRAPALIANLLSLSGPAREKYAVHIAEQARTVLVVPIIRGAQVVGSLVAGYRSKRVPGDDELSHAAALASQAAVAVENARLIEGLRQADRVKDEFLSAAAHELKTPVTTIKGYTEMWARDGRFDERYRRSLESVIRQTERIASLTRDLLAVVRLRSGPPALVLERCDLSALVRELVNRTARIAGEAQVSVAAPDAVVVHADAQLIGDVLTRLVENGIRYSPARLPVEVAVHQADGKAIVAVRDHGVGIPADRQPHIFEPFYEPVPSGEPAYVGLVSLGLFVSKQIIDAHGGRIWFESSPGLGSTFCFSLPLAEA